MVGDLVSPSVLSEVDAVAHGCNCFCTMKSGVAKAIVKRFPYAEKADADTPRGSREKLGSCTSYIDSKFDLVVFNLYTQYEYGTNSRKLDYEAMVKCLEGLDQWAGNGMNGDHPTIAFPMIGCGLAGGSWPVVRSMLQNIPQNYNVLVVVQNQGDLECHS